MSKLMVIVLSLCEFEIDDGLFMLVILCYKEWKIETLDKLLKYICLVSQFLFLCIYLWHHPYVGVLSCRKYDRSHEVETLIGEICGISYALVGFLLFYVWFWSSFAIGLKIKDGAGRWSWSGW